MMTIEISDKSENNVLSFGLREILDTIKGHLSEDLIWVFYELQDSKGIIDFRGWSIMELENKVNNTEDGIVMTWDEMYSFAATVFQVVDATIYGIDPLEYKRCDGIGIKDMNKSIIIESVDSTLWSISFKNKELIKEFSKKFQNITETTI